MRRGQGLLVIAGSRKQADSITGLEAGSGPVEDSGAECTVVPWYEETVDWALRGRGWSVSSGGGGPAGPALPSILAPTSTTGALPSLEEEGARSSSSGGRRSGRPGRSGKPSRSGRSSSGPPGPDLSGLSDHVILCGSPESFVEFTRTLRAVWGSGGEGGGGREFGMGEKEGSNLHVSPTDHTTAQSDGLPLVLLHPSINPDCEADRTLLEELRAVGGGAVYVVRGAPSDASALERACASRARCALGAWGDWSVWVAWGGAWGTGPV